MIDLAPFVRAGQGVWWGQAGAEPTPLVHALLEQVSSIGPVSAFVGLTWDARLTTDIPSELTLVSYGALGELRKPSKDDKLEIVPCHYFSLQRLFAEHKIPSDVGFVQVSPPDNQGYCTLGIGVEYVADALAHTPVLIAEINEQMPTTVGGPRIHVDEFAATINTNRPLNTMPNREPTDADLALASNVASLVEDGDTIQFGVGVLPAAVLDALSTHTNLGIHSGMIADGLINLVDKGVVDGSKKPIDTGLIVTGAALGTERLYSSLQSMPVAFRASSYTHHPKTLAEIHNLVSINSAIEVDLTGQVGAEVRGGVHVGAIGGQADFSRAAAATGARSIIALRATSNGESAIVPRLRSGIVTLARADVDHVVTEFGIASLRGCNLHERSKRLIAVAAPEHRDDLQQNVESDNN